MFGAVLLSILTLLTCNGCSGTFECRDDSFDCGDGECISSIWVCDSDRDCLNNKDEENCDEIPESKCMSSEFACLTDKHCIPMKWYCDGEHDCKDGSDETDECGAKSNSTECGFRCPDHRCIPEKWICDGNEDCPDAADEKNCSVKSCLNVEFLCSSGSCIDRNLLCDGKDDCSDGSDEGSHCGDACENTTCSQYCKSTPSGPRCYCKDGYVLSIDNRTCLDIDECQEDGFCSQKCSNLPGNYQCSCLSGYELVNRTCKAKGDDPLLLFFAGSEIRGMGLRSRNYFSVHRTANLVVAFDVDPTTGRIYWLELSHNSSVYSSNMDGTDMRTVIDHGLMMPEDICIDYIARNLYLTDSVLGAILVCKIDGTMCSTLHKNISNPRSIVIDLEEKYVYWSAWGDIQGIFRSSMDGTRRKDFVTSDIGYPNSIAIDHTINRLYWVDSLHDRIEYISLDGKNRKILLSEEIFHPFSLAVFEDTLYWTDWEYFSLKSCNKFTGHNITTLARENGKRMTGVHIYHPVLKSKVSNPCWFSGCSHLCLQSQSRAFRCECAPGYNLSNDRRKCNMIEDSDSLFISEGHRIFRMNPESVGNDMITELPLNLRSTFLIASVAYDSKSKILFIANMDDPTIHAVNLTNMHAWILIGSHLVSPQDIAFDWMSNNLYWVDSGKGTVEVISVSKQLRSTLVEGLGKPIAITVSRYGFMFIASIEEMLIIKYDMDGANKVILERSSYTISLSIHPTRNLLYWANPVIETISVLDFNTSSTSVFAAERGIMSVAVSNKFVYYTAMERKLHVLIGNMTRSIALPGQSDGLTNRKLMFSSVKTTEEYLCSVANGNCSHLCVSSPKGRTCICPIGKFLAADNITCLDGSCSDVHFKCIDKGNCIPASYRCDKSKDCEDGSDEIGCESYCSGHDFKCKNGLCVVESFRCDDKDDCGDNSDEEDCVQVTSCAKDQKLCNDGVCITNLWLCDGENDCIDGDDEIDCHINHCDPMTQFRCSAGQCVSVSWVCDGINDCIDGTDEKNCSVNLRSCTENQFRCISNGFCMDNYVRCDSRRDCEDGSDEKDCHELSHDCKTGMFSCSDGRCIYDYEVCNGHEDCVDKTDEQNCPEISCNDYEFRCRDGKRCIAHRWICDADKDCYDGSDESDCEGQQGLPVVDYSTHERVPSECDGFFCYATRSCLAWSQVCDGHMDCQNLPDEGGACNIPCSNNCDQVCQKTPQGSRCSCSHGYRLLDDNKSCEDINECLELGTCSQFCNNTIGRFKCSCADGYLLLPDRRTCKAVGSATLVYILEDQIRGIDLNSQSTVVYVYSGHADIKSVDYDAEQGLFYYTEIDFNTIYSYSPNTNRKEAILKSPLRPLMVRFDWIVGNLYYTTESGNIFACTKDGKYCSKILESGVPVESFDISPTTRYIFWTVWASHGRIWGMIERADMDGSNRVEILSNKLMWPTSLAVDHVLQKIYWVDAHLNTLESADLNGSQRRNVVKVKMYHPAAVSVFEDFVYWVDWGYRTVMKCNKYKERDCKTLLQGDDVMPEALMILHKSKQPKGVNRCLYSSCAQLCLPNSTGFICKCGDGYSLENGTCYAAPSVESIVKVPKECPEGYCTEREECLVTGPELYECRCKDGPDGDECRDETKHEVHHPFDYTWLVLAAVVVAVAAIIFYVVFICKNRDSLHRVSESVSVKFKNKVSEGRHLVMDTDEGGVCDESIILDDCEREYRHSPFGGKYTLADAEDGYKKWPYSTQTMKDNILNFFGRLKNSSCK